MSAGEMGLINSAFNLHLMGRSWVGTCVLKICLLKVLCKYALKKPTNYPFINQSGKQDCDMQRRTERSTHSDCKTNGRLLEWYSHSVHIQNLRHYHEYNYVKQANKAQSLQCITNPPSA